MRFASAFGALLALALAACDRPPQESNSYTTRKWESVELRDLAGSPITIEHSSWESDEVTLSGVKIGSSVDALTHLRKQPDEKLAAGLLYHEHEKAAQRNVLLEGLVRLSDERKCPLYVKLPLGKKTLVETVEKLVPR